MSAKTDPIREKILGSIAGVPALPASAAQVIVMVQDPEVDIDELVKAVEYDPGLTANVLRHANSAHYGGTGEVSSIQQAIVRLGLKQLSTLVVTLLAEPVTRESNRGYFLAPGALFEHSVAVAIGTRELARVLEVTVPPHAFTAGLLHDVGKVLLGTFVEIAAAPIQKLAAEEGLAFDDAERRVLGIDHAEAGAALLKAWNIPDSVADVVRWHHRPAEYGEDSLALDLVHVAEMFFSGSTSGAGLDALHYYPDKGVVSRLKIKPLVAESLVCATMSQLEELLGVGSTGMEH